MAGKVSQRRRVPFAGVHLIVGDKTFQMVDIDGLFHQIAVAFVFAEVRTDPTYGQGHGETLSDELERLNILPLGDEGNVSLYVDSGRTGELAGSNTVAVMLLEEQFKHKPPHLLNLFRIGGNPHAFFHFGTA